MLRWVDGSADLQTFGAGGILPLPIVAKVL